MKLRPAIPTTTTPDDPSSLYLRLMYHTFFYGPFKSEEDVLAAVKALDEWDDMWDYDCFCIVHGANPLPSDFVFGFPFVDDSVRERIEAGRHR